MAIKKKNSKKAEYLPPCIKYIDEVMITSIQASSIWALYWPRTCVWPYERFDSSRSWFDSTPRRQKSQKRQKSQVPGHLGGLIPLGVGLIPLPRRRNGSRLIYQVFLVRFLSLSVASRWFDASRERFDSSPCDIEISRYMSIIYHIYH